MVGSTGEIERQLPSWKHVRLRPHPVPRAPRRPRTLALRRRRPQRATTSSSVARLRSIKQHRSKDWTIVVYPGAGHGLFDDPPTDPRAAPTAEAWVRDHVVRR